MRICRSNAGPFVKVGICPILGKPNRVSTGWSDRSRPMTTPEENNLQMAMQQRWALVGLSVALFLLCLTQDGYYVEGPDPRAWASPAVLLSMGWLGVFEGVFAWLAN